MDMTLELLRVYEEASSCAAAEEALDELRDRGVPPDVSIGDLYDDLAAEAADGGEFELAARVQRKAWELGCERPDIASAMLGWYMLKSGDVEGGEEHFAGLRQEYGSEDIDLLQLIGSARLDSGRPESALQTFDEALALAKAQGDADVVDLLRADRLECRRELGLDPDEDDNARRPAPLGVWPGLGEEQWVLAWFPRAELAAAAERWPILEEELRNPDEYCAQMEHQLRDLKLSSGRPPLVAPLEIEALIRFAEREGLDPGTPAARSRFAAEAGRAATALTWPPGRNEPCWCGSGRKYKRCCGAR
jgi:tetratricopeptide (TPR) repeat protein